MKKLIHFLQTGRLVNIANFSVHTISSVVKKFLRKLPDGVFGAEAEKQLFDVLLSNGESPQDLGQKQEQVRRYDQAFAFAYGIDMRHFRMLLRPCL